jgi:hypothetical protein
MTHFIRWFGTVLLLAAPAFAQFNIALYYNFSSDDTNIYGTAELQAGPLPGCTMCSGATHTYDVALQITSPGGNTNSCDSGYQIVPATQSVGLQCQTASPINGETGTFTATFKPFTLCSVIGVILNPRIPIVLSTHTTFYTNNDGGTVWCTYHSLACTSGTPTCGVIPAPVGFGVFSPPCPAIARSSWLVVNGICDIHVDFAATQGGTCN